MIENTNEKRDVFYYVEVTDLQSSRDNRIAELFGEEYNIYYLGANDKKTLNLSNARFWKDKMAAERRCQKSKVENELNPWSKIIKLQFNVKSMNREEFIKSIPDVVEKPDYSFQRNLALKSEEIKYLKLCKKENT